MSRGSRAPRKHFPIDFRDKDGRYSTLTSTLLENVAPYTLYDYQLEGTRVVASGVDLLAVVPTGGGKTAFFTLPVQLLQSIASNTTVDPDLRKHYPKNPVMLVIMPTNSLSMEKEGDFNKLSGLRAVMINADAVDRARREGRPSPWSLARDSNTTHILLSPEQLATASYEELLKDPGFISRVLFLGVDEIHLLDTWGTSFRKIMTQIGFMRSRLPSHIVLIATTATLLAGARTRNILSFLGLRAGHYHKIHRSNIRHDIQLIIRPLSASIASRRFPDLLWVPQKRRRTIIYVSSIRVGWSVFLYLVEHMPSTPDIRTRIRRFNALLGSDYNARTLELMRDPNSSLDIIIASDIAANGNDSPCIWNVVILDTPADADAWAQKCGRVGRNPTLVKHPRAITYVPQSAFAKAKQTLDGASLEKNQSAKMHVSTARLLTADCLQKEQDLLYENPAPDGSCACIGCVANKLSTPPPCECSSCEDVPDDTLDVQPAAQQYTFILESGQAMSAPLRPSAEAVAATREKLLLLRQKIFDDAEDDPSLSHIPTPFLFLPDDAIDKIINSLPSLTSVADLLALPTIDLAPYAQPHIEDIYGVVGPARAEHEASIVSARAAAEAKKDAAAAARRATAALKKSAKSGAGARAEDVEMDDTPVDSGGSSAIVTVSNANTSAQSAPPSGTPPHRARAKRSSDVVAPIANEPPAKRRIMPSRAAKAHGAS